MTLVEMEDGKNPFYAVRKGRVTGVYTSWSESERQVKGFKRCSYRGFFNLEETRAYVATDSREEAESTQCSEQGVHFGQHNLHQGEMRYCGFTFQSVQPVVVNADTSIKVSLTAIAATAEGTMGMARLNDFPNFYVDEMEMMLFSACNFFGIGSPIFLSQQCGTNLERIRFMYSFVLPPNDQGLELIAYGPPTTDERIARQEASFLLLEKLLKSKKYTIYMDSATQLDAATTDQVDDIAATVEVAVGAAAQVNAANDPIAETPKDDSQPTTKRTRCLSSDVWHYFDKIGVGNDGKERV
ncbi:hypothetical protein PIB30_001668 [Stylosanthes scabra]|uniref:Ribonuclease H1 N-terminal domain-containing protein n=1 Tax=Stylosanthes scabra TaxID=79078 RepID=A0ABU6T3S8_9FABA|nr:hypothetical protein [Stylosanthes scabra]